MSIEETALKIAVRRSEKLDDAIALREISGSLSTLADLSAEYWLGTSIDFVYISKTLEELANKMEREAARHRS